VAAADFDHSGRLGLFIGGRFLPGQYPLPPQSALLANRGGKFEDVTDALAPGLREVGMVTSALWTDVDGDGWPDLLLALEWGNVRYFHNNQGRGFEDWTERAGFASAGTGWWTSIAAADFNGDGRLDYVVGNVGLNTQYHADPEHPALLFSGEFAGGASTQLIEAYYEGDKLYPWRTNRALGSVIPSVLKRYKSTDSYARATLGEILGEDRLAKARRFAATELRSGVFLSQPDGTYKLRAAAPHRPDLADPGDGGRLLRGRPPCRHLRRPELLRPDPVGRPLRRGPEPAPPRATATGISRRFRRPRAAWSCPATPRRSPSSTSAWTAGPASSSRATTRSVLAFRNRGVAGGGPLRIKLRGPPETRRPSARASRSSWPTAPPRRPRSTQGRATTASRPRHASLDTRRAPPRRIAVRWPSGRTTEQGVTPGTAVLVLAAPEP
jgi:enediyne biosynthesis protein E4